MNRFIKQIAVIGSLSCSLSAYAVPTLSVSTDGVAYSTLAIDGGAGDLAGTANSVVYSGSFSGWTISSFSGDVSGANMIVHYSVVHSGAGSLYLQFSATDFTQMGSSYLNASGTIAGPGAASASTTFSSSANSLNTIGGGLPLTGVVGPFTTLSPGPGAAVGAPVTYVDPYAKTVTIQLTQGATMVVFTGDATLSVPDGGTTVMLLGSALTGLGLIRRKLGKTV